MVGKLGQAGPQISVDGSGPFIWTYLLYYMQT
jgi:hypothetical protein